MATLEKIRSKSVILFVIIIVALLAFILGDFLTSGRTYFGSGDTMAEANGVKVKLDEYNNYRSAQGENLQDDPDMLEQQYINQLLMQKLLNKECDAAGIKVTDSELSQWMLNYDSEVRQFVGQLGYALGLNPAYDEQTMSANINAILERLKNPKKYQLPEDEAARLLSHWKTIEAQAEDNLRQRLYMMLVQALYAPNDVDAQVLYAGATNRDIEMVVISTGNVADEDVTVTDEDIKNVWENKKAQFKVNDDKRSLAYIVKPIQATDDDIAEAHNNVTTMVEALRADTTSLDALKADSRFVAQHAQLTKAQLNANYRGANNARLFRQFADTAVVGQTEILEARPGNYYVIGKILGIEQKADSVTFSQIVYSAEADADSLLNLAQTTQTWDSIKSGVDFMVNANEEISLQTPPVQSFATLPQVATLLRESPVGQVVSYNDTIQGQPINLLLRVDNRPAPVAVYDIARIDYVVAPSNATRSKVTGDFRNYLGNNSTTQAFTDNAAKSEYTVDYALVSNSTPTIAGLPDTRKLVKFAMDGKKGKVSPMIESRVRQRQQVDQNTPAIFAPVQPAEQSYLVAVALNDEYGKYIPWNDPNVRPRLETEARNLKKAQKLADQYKDKTGDLQALATEARTIVSPMTYSFNSGRYPAEVAAAIAKADDGQTTEAIATPQGLFVVKVLKTSEPTMKFEDSKTTYNQQFTNMFTPFRTPYGMINALKGDEPVENNTLKFRAGFDD